MDPSLSDTQTDDHRADVGKSRVSLSCAAILRSLPHCNAVGQHKAAEKPMHDGGMNYSALCDSPRTDRCRRFAPAPIGTETGVGPMGAPRGPRTPWGHKGAHRDPWEGPWADLSLSIGRVNENGDLPVIYPATRKGREAG